MISVIIPMYNSKETIQSAIESVVNQTYKNSIQIVVVNDGSKDGCEKTVEQLINNNQTNRTITLINKSNGGVSSARNRGIQESKGEWIALLDSDDIWLPTKLEKQIIAIESNNNIKFIGTNRNNDTYPFFKKNLNNIYSLNAKEILVKWHPHTSTALIHKSLLVKSGVYDETRSHAEDGDLWLRIANYFDLYVLNEDLVYTGNGKRSFGESGLSANMPKMYQGEILSLKAAKERNQINLVEFYIFHAWISFKYLRRKIIVNASKK